MGDGLTLEKSWGHSTEERREERAVGDQERNKDFPYLFKKGDTKGGIRRLLKKT